MIEISFEKICRIKIKLVGFLEYGAKLFNCPTKFIFYVYIWIRKTIAHIN